MVALEMTVTLGESRARVPADRTPVTFHVGADGKLTTLALPSGVTQGEVATAQKHAQNMLDSIVRAAKKECYKRELPGTAFSSVTSFFMRGTSKDPSVRLVPPTAVKITLDEGGNLMSDSQGVDPAHILEEAQNLLKAFDPVEYKHSTSSDHDPK